MKNHSNKQPQRSFRLLLNAACTFMLFLLLMPVVVAQTAQAPAIGNGNSDNPYQIATLENLIWLQEQTNSGSNVSTGKHFIQTADIDMISISNWTPIGHGNMGSASESSQPNSFRGVYDGQNFAIRNLRINSSLSQRGLFGHTWAATIKNVRIENADVIVGEASGILLGQSAHWLSGSTGTPPVYIERVSVEGRLISSGRRVGGIAGNPGMNTNITGQNVFIGEVTGTTDVGGLVGRASGSASVSFSYARAKVTGTSVGSSEGVGILVGNASTGAASFIEMYAEGEAIVTGGTENRGVIGFAPQPGSGSHTVTDVWFDDNTSDPDKANLVLIGNSGAPEPSWVTITGGGALTTSDMLGAAAAENMTGTGDRWDFDEDGAWRVVTIPEADYPVFEWQAGDEITISGKVTSGEHPLEGVTVTAQVGDATFGDVTTTTDVSGDYSFDAFSIPTQRVFARTTDSDGLPIGAAVEGPWEESATINLNLQPRSLTISDDPNNGWIRDGSEILAVEEDAVLNVNTLRDELLNGDRLLVAGVDIIFDADLSPALTTERTLTLRAGKNILIEHGTNIAPTNNALNLVLWSDINGSEDGRIHFKKFDDQGATIESNGGHIWMGGGSGSTTWNGLAVGDGYAVSPQGTANAAIYLQNITINTGVGHQLYRGNQINDATNNIALWIADGSTIYSTSGDISFDGLSNSSHAIRFAGVSIGWNRVTGPSGIITSGNISFQANKTEESNEAYPAIDSRDPSTELRNNYIVSTGDISFSGKNNGDHFIRLYGDDRIGWNGTDEEDEYLASNISITSEYGGALLQHLPTNYIDKNTRIYTKSTGTFSFTNKLAGSFTLSHPEGFIKAGNIEINSFADVNFGNWTANNAISVTAGGTISGIDDPAASSNTLRSNNNGTITIKANEITFSSENRIESGGELHVKAFTDEATIGIANTTGTLQLPASYFEDNFEAGFSQSPSAAMTKPETSL